MPPMWLLFKQKENDHINISIKITNLVPLQNMRYTVLNFGSPKFFDIVRISNQFQSRKANLIEESTDF